MGDSHARAAAISRAVLEVGLPGEEREADAAGCPRRATPCRAGMRRYCWDDPRRLRPCRHRPAGASVLGVHHRQRAWGGEIAAGCERGFEGAPRRVATVRQQLNGAKLTNNIALVGSRSARCRAIGRPRQSSGRALREASAPTTCGRCRQRRPPGVTAIVLAPRSVRYAPTAPRSGVTASACARRIDAIAASS